MNIKFGTIQKPRVFFDVETGCKDPDTNKLEDHNKRFDENIDENIDKKPGLVLMSFRGLLDGLVGGKKDEKTDKIRNDAMDKAKDTFRKLPKEKQQEELLKIWNDANTQAYPTTTQNPDDEKKKTESKESFSEKINKGVELVERKEVKKGADIAKASEEKHPPISRSPEAANALTKKAEQAMSCV